MKRPITLLALVAAGTLGFSTRVMGQRQATLEALDVFLDCQTLYCDFDHFRREMTFVNWVRDRQDAHLHILGTGQRTGGGGQEFTFTFIGLRQFAGQTDTLRYVSRNTDTPTEVRDGQVQTLKLGLVRYVAATQARERLRVTYEQTAATAPVAPVQDPWNLWVFNVRVGGNLNGEQLQKFQSFSASLSANRTAANLKLNFRLSGSFNRSEQELTTETFVNTSKNISASQVGVWSLGPHLSLGVRGSQSASTFLNQDIAVRGGPAVEYDVYPYDESTRRRLTVRYSPEVATFDYEQETIYAKTAETLPAHRLDVSLQVQQPWGEIETSVGALQYLHDLARHRVNLFGSVSLRIVRGLNLNLGGSVARIKDQIYLPGAGLTDEEILVRRRQLGTSFRYFTFFSLSYRFGSKFANIVNSRMVGLDEGDGGGFCFCSSF